MSEIYKQDELKEYAKEKSLIYTDCTGCVFAKALSVDSDVENACFANRVKTFKSMGEEILKIESDYDGGKIFAGIKNRVCNLMRPKYWSDIQIQKNENEFGADDLDKLEEIARKESRIRCNYIVYMKKDATKDECIEGLKRTVNSICNRPPSESPENLTVVVSPSMKPSEFMRSMREIQEEYPLPCSWNMEYILDKDIFKLSPEMLYEKCLKICMKSIKKAHYVAVFECGDKVPENYLTNFEEIINQKLQKVLLCTPKDKNSVSGTFIQYIAYKQFRHTEGDEVSFVDRLKEAAAEQGAEHLIFKLEDVIGGE